MSKSRMSNKVLVILAVAIALACASKGGPSSEQGGFVSETSGTDPGLSGRGVGLGASESMSGLETIYFDFDSSALSGDARQTLQRNAQFLRDNPELRIEVQGNCDERGSTEYNLALGQRRAEAARSFLVDLGIPATRIDTVSFGEENPAVRGHSETAWAKNRRDDFVNR